MQNSNRYIIFTTEQIPQTLKHRLTMNEQAHQYVEDFMAQLILRNPNEPEFHQAVREVAESLAPHIVASPVLQKMKVLERIAEPERHHFPCALAQ